MEAWHVGAVLAVLASIGGGLKWFLTWLFGELNKMREAYERMETESRNKFAELLTAKDARIDVERDARLSDREEHTRALTKLAESLRQVTVMATQSRTSKPPPSLTNSTATEQQK